ncbi:MAG TPA: hypothetical protein VIC24_10735 [Gemmatimonadaceae bacterium]
MRDTARLARRNVPAAHVRLAAAVDAGRDGMGMGDWCAYTIKASPVARNLGRRVDAKASTGPLRFRWRLSAATGIPRRAWELESDSTGEGDAEKHSPD